MATVTVSAPQQQVAMPAKDLRRFVTSAILNEGVAQPGHLLVSQRGAGANMSVDVAAGSAFVKDDHASGGGFYHAVFTGTENVVVSTADATNPRVDRVCLRVRDAYLGDADNTLQVVVLAGTPTAGATLANCNGAQALPGSHLLLANVLVGAGVTSITDANIDTWGESNAVELVRPLVGIGSWTMRKLNEKDIANTVAETDLFDGMFRLPAGIVSVGRIIRVSAIGDYLNNTGSDKNATVRIKLGGTTMYGDVTVNLASSATRRHWHLGFQIAVLKAANVEFMGGRLDITEASAGSVAGLGDLATSTLPNRPFGSSGTHSVDLSTAQTVAATIEHPAASASLSWRLKSALLEIV